MTATRRCIRVTDSLEDTANLPDPDVLAAEIVEDLQAAVEQFAEIAKVDRQDR